LGAVDDRCVDGRERLVPGRLPVRQTFALPTRPASDDPRRRADESTGGDDEHGDFEHNDGHDECPSSDVCPTFSFRLPGISQETSCRRRVRFRPAPLNLL
jgi:hypothetical protein